jgi:16S rRNA (uracil1498-N3)-methyltransferase
MKVLPFQFQVMPMSRYDFTTKRLYVEADLAVGSPVALTRQQANYLLNVLRRKNGDAILLFNGRDGEWLSRLQVSGRKHASLNPEEQTRPQPQSSKLIYLFAPLKKGRLDYMVQKAVEMGVGQLQPVITEYTQFSRLSIERMRSHVIEAAEQCGILALAECHEPVKLQQALENWPENARLIYCDEGEESQNPLAPLNALPKNAKPEALGVLIGPEGGFSESERQLLRSQEFVTAIPLGPRVLRADTAAVAALAMVQATLGDWY